MENKEKHTKRRNLEKRNANLTQRNQEKAYPTTNSRPSTGVDVAQTHPTTDQRRAVSRRTSQGAGTPWVWPHPLAASQAHSSGGGAINAPMAVACGGYQKYLTKPSYSTLYKKASSSHLNHIHIWRRRRGTHFIP